jgi:thiol-disulfide isomerase/thioredoxin
MNKLIFGIATILITSFAFAGGTDANALVKGKLDNAEGKTIFLEYFIQGKPVRIDSFNIKKNGKFEVEAVVADPDFYRLSFDENSFILLILSKDQELELTGNADDFNKSYTISGSHDSEMVKKFVTGLNEYSDKTTEINAKFNNPNTSAEEKQALEKEGEAVKSGFIDFRDSFINENHNSLAALTTLSHLNDVDDYELIKKITAGIGEAYPNSKYHLSLETKMKQIETRKKQEEEAKKMRAATDPGKVAPELGFKNPEGKIITLESLRGNYVLIDFWASWCGPCRRENPNVVRAYNKYKDNGFTVYSVSLDKDKARWVAAIKQDGLIWPNHVSDLKQWQSEAVKLYGFRGIPHTVLIDKDGKIVAKNLRGPALEEKLKELIGF